MFCPKCGTEVLKDAEFCQKCGTKLILNENGATSEAVSPEKLRQQPNHAPADTPKKKKSKKLPIILGVVAALLLVILIFPAPEKNDDSNVSPVDINGVNLSETYINEEAGISFKYPSGWRPVSEEELAEVSDGVESDYPLVLLANEVEDMPEADTYIMVSKFAVGQDDIDLLFVDDEQFATTFGETFDGNVSIEGTSVIELDGVRTRKITYIEQDSQFGYESYFYAVGFSVYRVDFNWIGETPGNNQRFFDAIIGSYKITSQKVDADVTDNGSIAGADAGAVDSTDSLKQILYNGVPVYSYLGRSLDDVQGEFGDYEYFKFGDTFQGKEIFFCRCDMLVFGYVEDRDDEIVYISAYPDEVSLNGSTLDLNPDDLVDLLPSPYFNEFDYDAFSYFVKYSMSDMPISVTFTMPDAISEAYDVVFSLDS